MTHDIHKRQTSTPLAGLEPAILSSKWLQTYASDCMAIKVQIVEEIY